MKYIYTALGLLALCLAICLTSTTLLNRYTEKTNQSLTRAMALAEADDYPGATRIVEDAVAYWKSHQGFFGIILRHDEADEVNAAFRALTRYASEESEDEFLPNCAELIERVSHLAQMERPAYYNVLTAHP